MTPGSCIVVFLSLSPVFLVPGSMIQRDFLFFSHICWWNTRTYDCSFLELLLNAYHHQRCWRHDKTRSIRACDQEICPSSFRFHIRNAMCFRSFGRLVKHFLDDEHPHRCLSHLSNWMSWRPKTDSEMASHTRMHSPRIFYKRARCWLREERSKRRWPTQQLISQSPRIPCVRNSR